MGQIQVTQFEHNNNTKQIQHYKNVAANVQLNYYFIKKLSYIKKLKEL